MAQHLPQHGGGQPAPHHDHSATRVWRATAQRDHRRHQHTADQHRAAENPDIEQTRCIERQAQRNQGHGDHRVTAHAQHEGIIAALHARLDDVVGDGGRTGDEERIGARDDGRQQHDDHADHQRQRQGGLDDGVEGQVRIGDRDIQSQLGEGADQDHGTADQQREDDGDGVAGPCRLEAACGPEALPQVLAHELIGADGQHVDRQFMAGNTGQAQEVRVAFGHGCRADEFPAAAGVVDGDQQEEDAQGLQGAQDGV